MNSNNPYDFIYFLGFIGGFIFANPEIAQVVAPYAAIFFAALVGSMWSLSRKQSDNTPGARRRGARYLFKIVGAAMIITVPIASILAPKLGFPEARSLFAVISLIIGAVGEDYPAFFKFCMDLFMRFRPGPNEGNK